MKLRVLVYRLLTDKTAIVLLHIGEHVLLMGKDALHYPSGVIFVLINAQLILPFLKVEILWTQLIEAVRLAHLPIDDASKWFNNIAYQ